MYEKNRLQDRFHDLISLAVYTILASIAALIVMDIIVLPICLLATSNKALFNHLVTKGSLFFITLLFVHSLYRRIRYLKDSDLSNKKIFSYLSKRPVYYIALAGFVILLSAIIIFLLYLLLSNNYYLIYKMSGS